MIFLCCIIGILLAVKGGVGHENLSVVTKLPRNSLMKYSSYSNVMILHFNVPFDTTKAVFKFQAKDEPVSIFVRSCDARDISVVMKPGSYPVINPDGVPFPSTFLNNSRPLMHELTLKTDMQITYLNLTAPVPGNWYAVAFVSWRDPKKDRIEQQGLSSECEAFLNAELLVELQPNITILTSNIPTVISLNQSYSQIYKFYVPEDIDIVKMSFTPTSSCKLCDNTASVQAKSIPNDDNNIQSILLNTEAPSYIRFTPLEENWHYLNMSVLIKPKNKKHIIEYELILQLISAVKESAVSTELFKTSIDKKMTMKRSSQNYRQYNLMRLTGSENFMFEYDFQPDENDSIPLLLNVTSDKMAVLKFDIYEVIDIGGTLTVGLALKPEKKSNEPTTNYTVVTCIHKDIRFIPQYPNRCTFNNVNELSPIVFNNTNAGTLKLVHIPYPEPGTWFMTMKVFYHDCEPCVCSKECEGLHDACMLKCEKKCPTCNCLTDCNDYLGEMRKCANCTCDVSCRILRGVNKNASMIFSISSHPCIAGRCGDYGRCNHYMAGGFIFSSCQCFGGYRGWDCSDDSQARSEVEILTSILFLTLSNLLFLASMYFAYKRTYYTECIVYFFTMFFSTFYHACDSEENMYGFCLVRLSVLQFCDFYCGLLSIWVTLIAMSYVNQQIVSICHLGGAILLAFGTIYNKQALWVFLMPAISGIVIISINWGLQCFQTKKLFPTRRYLKMYMPIGVSLVLMGLISFAFLQTKENYKIVHSLWHIIMAASVIFLLPNKEIFLPNS